MLESQGSKQAFIPISGEIEAQDEESYLLVMVEYLDALHDF